MENSLLSFAMIIVSTTLVLAIVLQSKGAGLGGLTGGGGDMGGTFSARRGLEKTLFRVTILLSVMFFSLAIYTVLVTG
ncbi:MAG TPA: preprotein translocase subunit SecG [Anaerolineales bacterium]|nr:preprotein translocase subunit SecG [Anaerolineales bacterium]